MDGEGGLICVGVSVLCVIGGGDGVSRSIGRSSKAWGRGDGGLRGLFKMRIEGGEGGSKSIEELTEVGE